MKNSRGDGRTLVDNGHGGVSAGDFVSIGDIVGVASDDAASGEDATFWIEGEFLGPQASAGAVGSACGWDGNNWVAAGTDGIVTKIVNANYIWVKLTP